MFSPTRARIIGTRHMAAAGHYLAAQAAFQILEAGGNAIDAGVAGGIALGIVQSEYVGFGGVAPIMIFHAETDTVTTISGLGTWPQKTDIAVFNERFGGRIPKGILRTVVPAAQDAWITALQKFGTMSYGEVAAASLRFAREGFPVPKMMSDILKGYAPAYRENPDNAALYLPGGQAPETGDILVLSPLADAIQYMIDQERAAAAKGGRAVGLQAAHHAFYKGDIAKAIVRVQEQHDGWLTADDLAGFHSEVSPALQARYGQAEVYTCGPWCQGPVLGEALQILDGLDLKAMGHNSPAYIHTITEALKLAFGDRETLYGDPNFVEVPVAELFSADYAAKQRARIDPAAAHPGLPDSGLVRGRNLTRSRVDDASHLDTSYVCTVDRHGNAFSATPSDGSVGSPIIPEFGFVPSNRGVQNWTDPNHPAALGPGRRPRLTPSPAFARQKGEWLMPIGSPGNDVQPQAILQAFLNMRVWGMSPQDAIDAPRFATFSYPRSSDPHSFSPGLLRLEDRIPADVRDDLRGLGHDPKPWPAWDFEAGGVCAIFADQRARTLEGGSDPRRPTAVAGW